MHTAHLAEHTEDSFMFGRLTTYKKASKNTQQSQERKAIAPRPQMPRIKVPNRGQEFSPNINIMALIFAVSRKKYQASETSH